MIGSCLAEGPGRELSDQLEELCPQEILSI